jgi:hypothetical protein
MYRFKSRAAGDLIMLEPNGRQILQILGRTDEASQRQGILLPEHMPGALVALQDAIRAEAQQREQQIAQAQAEGTAAPRFEGISLRQRALPFIEMIQRCQQADREIVWGV